MAFIPQNTPSVELRGVEPRVFRMPCERVSRLHPSPLRASVEAVKVFQQRISALRSDVCLSTPPRFIIRQWSFRESNSVSSRCERDVSAVYTQAPKMERKGIEPLASRLQSEHSSVELLPQDVRGRVCQPACAVFASQLLLSGSVVIARHIRIGFDLRVGM